MPCNVSLQTSIVDVDVAVDGGRHSIQSPRCSGTVHAARAFLGIAFDSIVARELSAVSFVAGSISNIGNECACASHYEK